jgi:hypothetical protein
MFRVNTVQQQDHVNLAGSWSWSYFNWIIKFNEFWTDLCVYIIKLNFEGYSCKEPISRI